MKLAYKGNVFSGLPNGGTTGQILSKASDEDGDAIWIPRWSNRNLLDNRYLANPINQLGQAEYAGGSWRYIIDRWMSNLTVTLEDGWIKLHNDADYAGHFLQRGELDFHDDIVGSMVTLSFLYRCNQTGCSIHSGVIENNESKSFNYEISPTPMESDNMVHVVSASGILKPLNISVWQPAVVEVAPGATVYLKAAKFELGSQQTLAHQDEDGNWILNDPPPDYGVELAKCQRYMLVLPGLYWYSIIGVGHAWSTTDIKFSIPIPVPMKAKPTVIGHGVYQIIGLGKSINFNLSEKTINAHAISSNSIGVDIQGLSGLVNNQLYILEGNNDNGQLIFDANL